MPHAILPFLKITHGKADGATDARRSGWYRPRRTGRPSRSSCSRQRIAVRAARGSPPRQAWRTGKRTPPALTSPFVHIPERVGGVRSKLLSFRAFLTSPNGEVKPLSSSWTGRSGSTSPTPRGSGRVGELADRRAVPPRVPHRMATDPSLATHRGAASLGPARPRLGPRTRWHAVTVSEANHGN